MKISVAVATYNGEKYIYDQLLSLYRQQRPADEVIITDDCSTDATVSVIGSFLQQYHPANWKLLVNETNTGLRRNFMKGLSHCTGDICFLCDQDDIWCREKLAVMEKAFLANEKIAGLACGYTVIPADKKYENDSVSGADVCPKKKCVTAVVNNPGCCCAFKKEIVDEYLQINETGIIHDALLEIIASSHDAFYSITEQLTLYRIHGENAVGLQSGTPQTRLEWHNRFYEVLCIVSGLPLNRDYLAEINRQTRLYAYKIRTLKAGFFELPLVWLSGLRYVRCADMKYYLKDLICSVLYKRHYRP